MLFSNRNRTDLAPRRYAEPDYEFLDRSARPEAIRVRNCFEEWFSRYPQSEQNEFCSRFQSIQFVASSFELYLHEILLRLGYSVEIHPENPTGKSTRPDFHVVGNHAQFYLEASLCTETSDTERAANARMNVVYDTLNRLESPNFFLQLNIRGTPETPPSGRRLRTELSMWLAQLDPDSIHALLQAEGQSALPKYRFRHEGWDIEFLPIPKSHTSRGRPGVRPIGTMFFGARWGHTWQSIRDAVISKGSHYGGLQAPLVVALNVNSFHVDRIDEMQALFGQEQYILSSNHLESEPRMERAQNGVWVGPTGLQYRRISAVLIAPDVIPWTVAVRNVCLYHNPWANYQITGHLCRLSQAVLNDNVMEWHDGVHPKEILGLPDGWPETNHDA